MAQHLTQNCSHDSSRTGTNKEGSPEFLTCPFCQSAIAQPVPESSSEIPVATCLTCDANVLVLSPCQSHLSEQCLGTSSTKARRNLSNAQSRTRRSGLVVSAAFCLLNYFLLVLVSAWAFEETKKRYDPYDTDEHLYTSFVLEAQGWTHLHLAAARGDEAVLRQLLTENHQVDAKNQKGRTPLYEAAKRGQVGSMTILLDHGANPEIKAHYGFTPLFPAIQRGHLSAVELLIERGAQMNVRCDCGSTALYEAVKWDQGNIVGFLIGHGAAINAKVNGQTALAYAEEHGLEDIAEILRRSGAKTFKDSEGLVDQGNKLFNEGQLDQAIRLFSQAIAIDQDSIPAYSGRAAAWIKKGDLDLALADYQRILQIDPIHIDTHMSISWIYAQRQQWDLGIELWSGLIKLQPSNGQAYYERAHHTFSKQDSQATQADLNQSCSLGYIEGCAMLKSLGGS